MFVILSAVLLVTTADVVHGKYQYQPQINGWVKLHRVVATWEDALNQCMREDAVLASPINEELRSELQILFNKTPFFIGANARFHPNIYMSVEGVLLEDMPLEEMYDSLDSNDGRCLSMNSHSISAKPCEARLPFACYKQQKENMELTECGTFDTGYKLEHTTGSCYKYHYQLKNWTEAYATCVAEGGYLAIINNNLEAHIFLANLNDTSMYMMTGVRDWMGRGSWMSIHGDPVQALYNFWEDNKTPTDSYGNSAEMHPTTGKLKPFESEDKSFFICEKDPKYIMYSYHTG